MSVLKRKSDPYLGKSEDALRARIFEIRQTQRMIRREHGGVGPYRDVALAHFDALKRELDSLAAERLRTAAIEGNARPLGSASEGVSPAIREAALLDWMAHGGFLDRMRAEIERADGFAAVTSTEMRDLLAPLDDEVAAIESELARRHQEKVELRRRLRELETVEA